MRTLKKYPIDNSLFFYTSGTYVINNNIYIYVFILYLCIYSFIYLFIYLFIIHIYAIYVYI